MSDKTETPTRLFVEFGIEPVMGLRTLRRWQDEPFVASGSDGPEPHKYVLLSAVQADPAKFGVGLKVKQLEFVQVYSAGKNKNYEARAYGSAFRIEVFGKKCYWWPPQHRSHGVAADNLEAAKAAAQTHFETMISECLV